MIEETAMLKALESRPEKARERFQDHPFIFNAQSLNRYKESILKGIELIQKTMSATAMLLAA